MMLCVWDKITFDAVLYRRQLFRIGHGSEKLQVAEGGSRDKNAEREYTNNDAWGGGR